MKKLPWFLTLNEKLRNQNCGIQRARVLRRNFRMKWFCLKALTEGQRNFGMLIKKRETLEWNAFLESFITENQSLYTEATLVNYKQRS